MYHIGMSKILQDIRNSPTFRLRKNPQTFADGFSSILNINSEIMDLYKTNDTDEESDLRALQSDWKAVGKDLYTALKTWQIKK
jgi:hypothetical protein